MKRTFTLILFLLPFLMLAQELKSPNGNFKLKFTVEAGQPTYQLALKNNEIIKASTLGLELVDTEDLIDNFEVINTENSTFDETWKPVWGETSTIRNHYNELLISLKQKGTERLMIIRFRLLV